jgi:hypothetical protein
MAASVVGAVRIDDPNVEVISRHRRSVLMCSSLSLINSTLVRRYDAANVIATVFPGFLSQTAAHWSAFSSIGHRSRR